MANKDEGTTITVHFDIRRGQGANTCGNVEMTASVTSEYGPVPSTEDMARALEAAKDAFHSVFYDDLHGAHVESLGDNRISVGDGA